MRMSKRDIFSKREQIQPYEYPHLLEYADAIWGSFWAPDHFEYSKDLRDFKIELTDNERDVVEKSMLAISVVENKVKSFWPRIEVKMPKAEISDVGSVFGGNEVVHRRTYERLLNILGLSERFQTISEVPCMDGRIKYLSKYLEGVNSRSNKEFTKSLILFTLLVENCSLFSQFLILSSFSKYKNIFKNFKDVINATAREEMLHGRFGAELINIIRQENEEWFDDEMENKTRRAIRKAYKAESEVLDWIFEKGELDFISKDEILEFLKNRLNDSLNLIGYDNEFEVDDIVLEKSDFLERMLLATRDGDFFDSKNTDYSKNNSYSEESLWD